MDRLSVLLDMARILHVEVESLIGRPWQLAPNGGAVAQGLDAVRQVMTRYDLLREMLARTRRPNRFLHERSVRAGVLDQAIPVPEYLALVVCGAPLAARCHDIAAQAVEAGWLVRVAATASAMAWVNAAQVERITGCAVLREQRRPGQAKRFPPQAQVIVCPATFNMVNKLAAGIMDNYAAGVLCEALASQIPMTIAPMVSSRLWSHPAWQQNLDILAAAGVRFVDIQTGRAGQPAAIQSGAGGDVVTAFDPAWVVAPASS